MSLLCQVYCKAIDSKLLRFSHPTKLTFQPRPASEGSEDKETLKTNISIVLQKIVPPTVAKYLS